MRDVVSTTEGRRAGSTGLVRRFGKPAHSVLPRCFRGQDPSQFRERPPRKLLILRLKWWAV